MPSPAALEYNIAAQKARILRETATDPRLRPISHSKTQVYYHSALATFVAGWEAYIEELVRNFFDVTANPYMALFGNYCLIFEDNKNDARIN